MVNMRRLPKPTDNVADVLSDCISNLRDVNLQANIILCKEKIVKASHEFEKHVIGNHVYAIELHEDVDGLVTKDDMKKIYNNKFAKINQPGRKYYDKILSLPKYGKCPLCGQRIVSTLDHYLPKMRYPSLAVTPSNLVPACKDCNTDKLDYVFSCSEDETIHPYFNNIEEESWLYAKLKENNVPVITFEVRKPSKWSIILYKRVENHFKVFKLNKLYSIHAATEFSGVRGMLLKIYQNTGAEGLKEHLIECHKSYKESQLNSWQAAMYKGLSESQWFCHEWANQNSS